MINLFRSAPVGIDLGSGYIKVVRISGNKVALAAFLEIPASERDDETLLTGKLNNFFKELNIAGSKAVVHISGAMSFIRTVNLPPMTKGELKEAVKWEIKRQLPYPVEDAVYDYITQETPDGITVTFASAERNSIEQYLHIFRKSGLDVIAVDVNSLSIMRALQIKSPGNIILIDIGHTETEINIIKAGVLRITRTVEMGSKFIKTQLIQSGLSDEDAEKITREGSEEKLKDILDQFLKEILRSVDYYKANFKEKTFAEVILTGGVSINPAVRDYFSHTFDIGVSVPNPFEGLAMKDPGLISLGPMFSVAAGLARRSD